MSYYHKGKPMSKIAEQLEWLPEPFEFTTCPDDGNLLRAAHLVGTRNSPDPSTKNGAILVHNGGQVCAANRFPEGIDATAERLYDRPTKYRLVVHAEEGVILLAARCGISTKSATIYCPFFSCSNCAKAIIQAGITRLVGHAQTMVHAGDHQNWIDTVVSGWEMMQEAGVQLVLFDGKLGVDARMDYKDISV